MLSTLSRGGCKAQPLFRLINKLGRIPVINKNDFA